MILMHELAHAIFDAPGEAACLDYKEEDSISSGQRIDDVKEQRAQAFAQECLVPREVLRHITQVKGINWNHLQPRQLALLVQMTTVEASTVLAAAVDADYITQDQSNIYARMEIGSFLHEIDDRALSTSEYLEKLGIKDAPFAGKRATTIPKRKITLPVGYINRVLAALKEEKISLSRASELLMIDKDTFAERFPDYSEVPQAW